MIVSRQTFLSPKYDARLGIPCSLLMRTVESWSGRVRAEVGVGAVTGWARVDSAEHFAEEVVKAMVEDVGAENWCLMVI